MQTTIVLLQSVLSKERKETINVTFLGRKNHISCCSYVIAIL